MKIRGLLDKIFESGADSVPVLRTKTNIDKKKGGRELDVLTITVGEKEYSFVKHDNDDWIRWSNE